MATLTNVLLNCQTASYGEIFNVVDYILLAPLEGNGRYFGFAAGRPTATIYIHLRAGGAAAAGAGAAASQMIYHQCMLAQFAIITRAIRDLPSTDVLCTLKATYVAVASAGAPAGAAIGGGLTGTYNTTLYRHNDSVGESSVMAQNHSIRALEAAHHAMATVINGTDAAAAVRQGGRRDLCNQATAAANAHSIALARGSVVLTFGGQQVGLQYIITGGTGAAQNVPPGVAQVDINGMSVVVAAAIQRQVVRTNGQDGEWWGGLPRMFFEFIRTHAAIAPNSPDAGAGGAAAAAAAVPAVNDIRVWWAPPPAAAQVRARLQLSAPTLAPGAPLPLWGAGMYLANPNWALQSVWGAAPPPVSVLVLQRDNVAGRNPPHLGNAHPNTHANEVLAAAIARTGVLFQHGANGVQMDGLAIYRQDDAGRRATPPWIAAGVAMLRFLVLPANTLVIGRRSSVLEAAYVSGIAVYVLGDETPAANPRDWNPIFAQETEQNPIVALQGDDLVPIGCWRRPRAAPFSYLSTQHRDVAYHLLNGAARPGGGRVRHLYRLEYYWLGGSFNEYLVHELAAGANAVDIDVTAEIV